MPLPFDIGGDAIPDFSSGFDTAGNILADVANELGLPAVSDPFASQDPSYLQLKGFLKRLGRALWRKRQWSHLLFDYEFTTVANQAQYPLPADFGRMVDQTGWNRTTRLPLGGPLSPQEWQYLKALQMGLVFTVLFRPRQQQLWLYPDTNTPGSLDIAFEYVSRFWVQANGDNVATKDAPTASTDTILFDCNVLVCGVKLLWLRAKGFDSAAAQQDFTEALDQYKDQDASAPVLDMDRDNVGFPLLSERNIPITGFGTA